MSDNTLKVVGGTDVSVNEETTPETPDDGGFTEELPPLPVDPRSFDARIAGIERCSVARELAKHHSSIIAFDVKREQERREAEGLPPTDERRLFRERWLEVCSRRHPDPDEYVEFIKAKSSRFVDWGDIGTLWNESPAEAI
ncbi:MAG: hypothetical protein ACJ741_09650, partial [Pyrinomonadaceae bacterium]